MDIGRQINELATVMMLVGCSTIVVAVTLRSIAPERWPMFWYCLVAVAAAWFGVAIWQGYELWMIKRQMDAQAAKGLLVMGPIPRAYLWLIFLVPSLPALMMLLWFNPKRVRGPKEQT